MALIFDEWGNFICYTPNGKDSYDYWYRDKYKLIPMNLKGIKDRKIKELSKERIIVNCIIRPIEEERVVKERFIQYNTIENIRLRQEQFKLYYYGSTMTIEELKEEELKRMLESYNSFKSTSKGKNFYSWLKSYVVIDYELLLELVKLASNTKQQRYKKMKSIDKVFTNLASIDKKIKKDEYTYNYVTKEGNLYKDKEHLEEELEEARQDLKEMYLIQLRGFIDRIKVDERYREVKYKSELRSYNRRLKTDEERYKELKRLDEEARTTIK